MFLISQSGLFLPAFQNQSKGIMSILQRFDIITALALSEMELILPTAALIVLRFLLGARKGVDNPPVVLGTARTASGLSPQHSPSPVCWWWARS